MVKSRVRCKTFSLKNESSKSRRCRCGGKVGKTMRTTIFGAHDSETFQVFACLECGKGFKS